MASISPNDSILNTTKKMLGVGEDYDAFDVDILNNINSVFLSLNELGVGTDTVYSIDDSEATWSDFLGSQIGSLRAVATYIYLKVRLIFDPPTSSFVLDAIKEQISELEFRLNVYVDDGSGGGD